ncbi:hypothetical protein PQX77_007324 [Marasmius sp. AFHP31]|nr:hypothetical protein PQX77_007324 [Marasmius sp. AFHP31]
MYDSSAPLSQDVSQPKISEYHGQKNKKTSQKSDITGSLVIGWLDAFRLRIIASALYGFRCILTWEPGGINDDLNFCHLVARTTYAPHIRALEYAIGLYPETLFLDCYLNLIIMKVDLHHAFDKGKFLLIPPLQLLHEILGYLRRNARHPLTKDRQKFYEAFPQHEWTYELLNLSLDPERSINRKNIDTSRPVNGLERYANRPGYTEYCHPFDHPDLKDIRTFAHPVFSCFNAVFALWETSDTIFKDAYIRYESVRILHDIGLLLNAKPPREFYRTGPGRVNEPPKDENLDYLFPQEATYVKRASLYRELLEEFQKAWDGELEHVLSGGVVAKSARKRTSVAAPRVTRSSEAKRLNVMKSVLDADEGAEAVVEEGKEVRPKIVPTIGINSSRPRPKNTESRSASSRKRARDRHMPDTSHPPQPRIPLFTSFSERQSCVEDPFESPTRPSKRLKSSNRSQDIDEPASNRPTISHDTRFTSCQSDAENLLPTRDDTGFDLDHVGPFRCLPASVSLASRFPSNGSRRLKRTCGRAASPPTPSPCYAESSDEESDLPLGKRRSASDKKGSEEWSNYGMRKRLKRDVLKGPRGSRELLKPSDHDTSEPIQPSLRRSRRKLCPNSFDQGLSSGILSSGNCAIVGLLPSPNYPPATPSPRPRTNVERSLAQQGRADSSSRDTDTSVSPGQSPYAHLVDVRGTASGSAAMERYRGRDSDSTCSLSSMFKSPYADLAFD